jgi:hypothetical protein
LSRYDDPNDAVLDLDLEGVHGDVRREGERSPRPHVEAGPVPRADGDALVGLEVALAKGPVVVRERSSMAKKAPSQL